MTILTNPIRKSNIASRLNDFVALVANAGIVYGTNYKPRYGSYYFATSWFGGTTAGRAADTWTGTEVINADNLYAAATYVIQQFSSIRSASFTLTITGAGGNAGSWPSAGDFSAGSGVSYLNTGFQQSNYPSQALFASDLIYKSDLDQFLQSAGAYYVSMRGTTSYIGESTCHSSCHTSCHSSRGRR